MLRSWVTIQPFIFSILASRSCTPLLFSYPLRGILRKSKNINIFSISHEVGRSKKKIKNING